MTKYVLKHHNCDGKCDEISHFVVSLQPMSGECGHVSEIGSLLAVPHLLRMVVIVTIGLNCIGKVFPRRNHLSPDMNEPWELRAEVKASVCCPAQERHSARHPLAGNAGGCFGGPVLTSLPPDRSCGNGSHRRAHFVRPVVSCHPIADGGSFCDRTIGVELFPC